MTTTMAPPTRILSPAPGDTGTTGTETEGLVTLAEGTAGAYPVGETYLLTVEFQALVQTDGLGRRAVGVCVLPGQLVTAGPHEVTVTMEVE